MFLPPVFSISQKYLSNFFICLRTAHCDQSPLPNYSADDSINPPLPPPYADEPPAYSTVVGTNTTVYTNAPLGLDYMSKLPYGDPDGNNFQLPLQPPWMQYQEPHSQQLPVPQFSYSETSRPQISNADVSSPQPTQPDTSSQPSSSLPTRQQSANSITPHKDLLKPTPSRLVETKSRHGKTKSHIKDLQTGKEYFIKEKVSRDGQRSKTVVVEIGGPKTIVKETPKRTIVCQKKK